MTSRKLRVYWMNSFAVRGENPGRGPSLSGSNVHSLKAGPLMLFFLVVFLVSTIVAISLIKDRDKSPNRKRAIRFFGFVSIVSVVGMAVLSSPPDKSIDETTRGERKPDPTPISSTKQSPIGLILASLGDNKLQIRAADLRSVPNPKGQGVFVYVPKTRFRGDERYILWMVIDGKAYAMNGATKNVTPNLVWPREAPADTWRKTALDKYTVTEAMNIVFKTENVGGRAPEPVQAGQQKEGSFPSSSPTCGPIVGKSKADLQNVKRFCSEAIPEKIVVGAYAMDMMLWVKVNQTTAQTLLSDTLRSERIIRTWMKGWKQITGEPVVTIYVEWDDIEIAKGQTTAFSGDKVSFRK